MVPLAPLPLSMNIEIKVYSREGGDAPDNSYDSILHRVVSRDKLFVAQITDNNGHMEEDLAQ